MNLDDIKYRINKKLYRREHRRHLRRWWADGGDERFRFDYDLTPASFVMDLGGYEGQWASDLYGRHLCRIAVFEPVAGFAENIRRRFAKNDHIDVFQFGLAASARTERIYIRGAGSSTYGKKAKAEKIELVDVRDWFDKQEIKSVDLMKINIEGGEFELLERMIETGLTKKVSDIQVQFHNIAFESTMRMEAIKDGLAETHTPGYQYKFVWENWKRKKNVVT